MTAEKGQRELTQEEQEMLQEMAQLVVLVKENNYNKF